MPLVVAEQFQGHHRSKLLIAFQVMWVPGKSDELTFQDLRRDVCISDVV